MALFCFSAQILPGKTDQWKRMTEEMLGSRRQQYEECRGKAGITRELAWLQHTATGDVVSVFWEVADPQGAFEHLSRSQDPFDQWNRERISEILGWDWQRISKEPIPELAFDWESIQAQVQEEAA
ncbi:MAG TPA: hypothetical protein VHS06_00250 [Chloroflexota bacterium]|nr:hypothetical protein [Chloroflexota bacterium]